MISFLLYTKMACSLPQIYWHVHQLAGILCTDIDIAKFDKIYSYLYINGCKELEKYPKLKQIVIGKSAELYNSPHVAVELKYICDDYFCKLTGKRIKKYIFIDEEASRLKAFTTFPQIDLPYTYTSGECKSKITGKVITEYILKCPSDKDTPYLVGSTVITNTKVERENFARTMHALLIKTVGPIGIIDRHDNTRARGPTGATGPAGHIWGCTGATGATGSTRGYIGATGAVGTVRGCTGATGATGATHTPGKSKLCSS
jgi:hypothetical protein